MPLKVRQAAPSDAHQISEFNRLLAWESEGKTLSAAVLEPGVAAVLADANKGYYFLAEEEGRIVGQLGLTFEWSDWRNGWFWWIQSVYVQADFRRQGVFRALFEHVRQLGVAEGVIGLRLYVEKQNARAHATYQTLGLEWTSYLVMERHPL